MHRNHQGPLKTTCLQKIRKLIPYIPTIVIDIFTVLLPLVPLAFITGVGMGEWGKGEFSSISGPEPPKLWNSAW